MMMLVTNISMDVMLDAVFSPARVREPQGVRVTARRDGRAGIRLVWRGESDQQRRRRQRRRRGLAGLLGLLERAGGRVGIILLEARSLVNYVCVAALCVFIHDVLEKNKMTAWAVGGMGFAMRLVMGRGMHHGEEVVVVGGLHAMASYLIMVLFEPMRQYTQRQPKERLVAKAP
ncbi:hypothetical protein CDD81_2292 [Ophiocordyceps australis]|uniref:Uncharacterized protein n=1 Tax=Ophiocordyceps australis TaxID=1399860 RepID=A0A2C5YDZ7_9HYPO|nr:hypothetical protein CDD81_2292 [Ophiocordyceps australis]